LSIASTSQFYNPREKRWATELFAKLGLPEKILADIVPPGTLLGTLLPHVAEATGLQFAPVYATCGHDTASRSRRCRRRETTGSTSARAPGR